MHSESETRQSGDNHDEIKSRLNSEVLATTEFRIPHLPVQYQKLQD
jgi:hypothetical protein